MKRCWAEIDLAALERNLGCIRAALPAHIHYVTVVKADAYGHGLQQTATRLMQSGAELYAVANVEEARQIREMGAGWPILILGALLPEEIPSLADYDLIATVSSPAEVEAIHTLGQQRNRRQPIHLKIDTGMGRLGIWWENAGPLIRLIQSMPYLNLAGVFTHFSSADTDPQYTREQRDRFVGVLRNLPDLDLTNLLIHADNSAGIETFEEDLPFNAVRVGLLQFGILPYPDSLLARVRIEPVFSFHARVGLVKTVPPGASISYGRTFQTDKATTLAILTAGYGDGIPVSLSNRGSVLIQGHHCPILGRVTMDQTIVDVSALNEVKVGEQATLIGNQNNSSITTSEFAEQAGTIPYEILTSITKRVTRIYKTSREL